MLKHITSEKVPVSSLKEYFSQKGDKVIVIDEAKSIRRHKPTVCPVCRSVFFTYGDAHTQYEVPEVQVENAPDRSGIIPPRMTCGSSDCYDAEWNYAFRSSPWYQSRKESLHENDVTKTNRALSEQRRELFGER